MFFIIDTSPIAQTGYDFDEFNRIKTKFCAINGTEFTKNITYTKTRPTKLFEMLSGRPLCTTNYTYDNMGRIATVTSDGTTMQYTYDAYGQLVEEKNVTLDKTIQYVYNGIGNISSVKTISSSGSTSTKNFTYGDTANPDRLTKFGSYSITYNTMGCPTSYNGKNFTWNKGKLTQVSQSSTLAGTTRYTYTYNGKGQRVQKVYTFLPGQQALVDYITRATTTYTYDNAGRLIREYRSEILKSLSTSNREFIYLYDESGMIGFNYILNGVDKGLFYYKRNLQGDVVAILDTNGNNQGSYSYDAYGNTTVSSYGSAGVASINPIRYRGYYYDTETSWYFLNARYYSPEWRRFISPDDGSHLNSKSVNGLNLYCYCRNNPVIYKQKAVYSDNAIALAPVSSIVSVSVGANSSAFDIGNNLKAFAQYIGGMFSTYTDYSRKIVNFPSFDLIFLGYEQGIIDTNIAGNDSAPIALFTKTADKWWEFWKYQVGIKNNIGNFSSTWSQGIGESNISFAFGDSSLDITLGLFRIGIGASRTIDDITYYNQIYIRPVIILALLVLAPEVCHKIFETTGSELIPAR